MNFHTSRASHLNVIVLFLSWVNPLTNLVFLSFQKEYIRYKQSKGWKHLVVYKSGIHALGLYTSQFIARGAMVTIRKLFLVFRICYVLHWTTVSFERIEHLKVVEYVGEIVGLRVADKREAEYQSGRRIQYKSACYFFRIDKEHIIDATRKGGIARFVNHSCLVIGLILFPIYILPLLHSCTSSDHRVIFLFMLFVQSAELCCQSDLNQEREKGKIWMMITVPFDANFSLRMITLD